MPQQPKIDLSDIPDVDLSDIPDIDVSTSATPKEDSSFLSSIWDYIYNQPLTTLPSKAGRTISEFIDPERSTSGPKAYASAFAESVGDVVSNLTTPLNLLTAGAFTGAGTAAKYGLPTAAKGLKAIGQAASVPVAAHGAYGLATGETLPEKIAGGVELIGGGLGIKSAMPKSSSIKIPTGIDIPPSIANKVAKSADDVIPSTKTEVLLEAKPKVTESRVVFDKNGKKRVLSPEEADDYEVQQGETYGIEKSNGVFIKLTDLGGNVPENLRTIRPRRREYPGLVKPTTDKTLSADLEASLAQRTSNEVLPESLPENAPPIKPPIGDELLSSSDINPEIPIEPRNIKPDEPASMFHEIYNLPRGLMSVDLPFMTSAAFRQASPLSWTGDWFKAWGKSAKAYGSEDAYKAIQDNISRSKYFKPRYKPITDSSGNIIKYKTESSFAEDVGLRMSDMKHLTSREESIASGWAERIPAYGRAVRASNRAYTAFLNDLRKNTFERLIDELPGGVNNIDGAKAIAEFVNNATGRGSLKVSGPGGRVANLEQSANVLSQTMFSPRLLASRIKFLNPYTYTQTPPGARNEYIKGLARTMGTWGAFAGLAEMAGASVGKNPNSSDFGKIRIGNTRIDPGAGFQQLLVLAKRMSPGGNFTSVSGKETEFGVGYKPRTRLTTAQEFAANKLHPSARFAYDLFNATSSNPFDVSDEIIQRAMPMLVTDLMQAAEEDPAVQMLIAPLSSVGIGAQTFEPGSYNESLYSPFLESLGLPETKYTGR